MSEFRKKPVVIEAWLFDGSYESYAAVPSGGMCQWFVVGGGSKSLSPKRGVVDIQTLEGKMRAEPGDWIIRGIKGEFYPCKPDIFAATYEPAALRACADAPDPAPDVAMREELRMGHVRIDECVGTEHTKGQPLYDRISFVLQRASERFTTQDADLREQLEFQRTRADKWVEVVIRRDVEIEELKHRRAEALAPPEPGIEQLRTELAALKLKNETLRNAWQTSEKDRAALLAAMSAPPRADALAPAPDVDDLAHDAKVQAVHLRLTQRANELHSAHVALEEAAEEIVNLHDELADALAPAAPMRVRVWQQGFDREDQAKVILERPDGQPFTRAEAHQIAAQVEALPPAPPSPAAKENL